MTQILLYAFVGVDIKISFAATFFFVIHRSS